MKLEKNDIVAKTSLLRNQSGWILAEALIGITIIAVGILAIMASHIQTTKTTNFSDNTTKATYYAQQELEKLKKTYDITQTIPTDPITCASPGGIFSLSCAVDVAALPVTGLNVVPVSATVTWTDSSSPQPNTLKLTTYFFHKN